MKQQTTQEEEVSFKTITAGMQVLDDTNENILRSCNKCRTQRMKKKN